MKRLTTFTRKECVFKIEIFFHTLYKIKYSIQKVIVSFLFQALLLNSLIVKCDKINTQKLFICVCGLRSHQKQSQRCKFQKFPGGFPPSTKSLEWGLEES